MQKLIKGIVDFRQKSIQEYRNKFSKLASKQTPDALFVACCDSRVVPNVFASSDPGDLFVLRNIGNLIPPHQANCTDTSVSAALEFSVLNLQISDIIVCGHSECGAMQTLLEANPNTPQPFLTQWLKHALPSHKRFQNGHFNNKEKLTPCNCLSRVNVLQQLENLKTYPCVAEKLNTHKIKIHGWWFDLATADVYYYNPVAADFVLIDETEANVMIS